LKFLLKIQVLLQSFFTLEMLINLPSLIHFLLSWFRKTHLKAFHLKAFHLETFLHFMMKQTYEREKEKMNERERVLNHSNQFMHNNLEGTAIAA
jgi:hypothetical protein